LKTCLLLLLLASCQAAGQNPGTSDAPTPQSSQSSQAQRPLAVQQETDELRQQLDVDAAALSKIPADPLIQSDPLAPIFKAVDNLADRLAQSVRLKFGATIPF